MYHVAIYVGNGQVMEAGTIEDIFRDGFGAATFGWSLSVGVTSD